MGFDLDEVVPAEEHPYSFREYLLQPVVLSSKIFSAVVSSPKLRYWFLATLISSIFLTIGDWVVMSKLVISVRVPSDLPQEAQEMVKGLIELTKSPLVIFASSLLGEIVASLIIALAVFILARLLAGRGSFSSGIMVAGLRSLPSVVYGMLLALLGYSMPETEWNIEIGTSGFEANIPWEVLLQESLLQFIISVWFLIVLLVCYAKGYGMTGGRAAAASLCTWVISNIFLLVELIPHIA